MTITVRSDLDPLGLVPAIRGVIQSMDPDLPITEVQSMDSVLGDSLSRTSFTMALLALAAAVALFLVRSGSTGSSRWS